MRSDEGRLFGATGHVLWQSRDCLAKTMVSASTAILGHPYLFIIIFHYFQFFPHACSVSNGGTWSNEQVVFLLWRNVFGSVTHTHPKFDTPFPTFCSLQIPWPFKVVTSRRHDINELGGRRRSFDCGSWAKGRWCQEPVRPPLHSTESRDCPAPGASAPSEGTLPSHPLPTPSICPQHQCDGLRRIKKQRVLESLGQSTNWWPHSSNPKVLVFLCFYV